MKIKYKVCSQESYIKKVVHTQVYHINCKISYEDTKNPTEGLYREEGHGKEGEKGGIMKTSGKILSDAFLVCSSG